MQGKNCFKILPSSFMTVLTEQISNGLTLKHLQRKIHHIRHKLTMAIRNSPHYALFGCKNNVS